jgi:hypothetical protein
MGQPDADWFQMAVGATGNVNSASPPASTIPVYINPDGSREVKVFGGQAFLYDMVPADNNHRAAFLSDNVKLVKFLPDPNGNLPRVWVLLNDGSTQIFDSKANLLR